MHHHIVLVNAPYEAPWLGPGSWIQVPPQGYGGIQWCVAMLADGLLELGCRLTILGAPRSPSWHPELDFPDVGHPGEFSGWLRQHSFDVVHDHSNRAAFEPAWAPSGPFLATHHLTGTPRDTHNVVFLSCAQRTQAGRSGAPVVRLPVNLARFEPAARKSSYLLFMGRISPWKGARQAAAFARAARRPLIFAGPAWEQDYLDEILIEYGETVEWIGEIGGRERQRVLAEACAILVFSQALPGPWGHEWIEPGAMVVAEAAASGTPVIATSNGCLAEIVPHVGVVISADEITERRAVEILEALPSPAAVRKVAAERWSHTAVATRYMELYERAIGGETF